MSTPLERDRRLARLRLERQRVREAARRRRRQRRIVAGGLLLVVLVGAVAAKAVTGGGGSTSATATPTPEPCSYRPDGTTNPLVRSLPTPPGVGTRRNGTATMVTDHGTVVFSLLANDAPCATTSFAFLAARHYFDGSRCDRLTTGGLQFLQCGQPKQGDGPGYGFPDENVTPTTTYPAGTVGMVNHGPDTNGGEFFLCYGDTQLTPAFTVLGRVTSGLDVLTSIAKAGATPPGDGTPNTPTTVVTLRTTGT